MTNTLTYFQITQLEETYDLPNVSHNEVNNGILMKDVPDGYYSIEYCFDGWKCCVITVKNGKIRYVEFCDSYGGTGKIDFEKLHSFYQGFIFAKIIDNCTTKL